MLEKKSNFRKVLLIIIVILILAGLGVAGYFIYKKQIAATDKAVLSPTPSVKSSGEGKVSSRNNPNGPYYHQIYSATSPDGLTWTKLNNLLFDHASVPGAVIKDKKIYLYFVDASGEEDQLSVAISADSGKTFEKQKVSIQDTPSYAAVDPHPELVDGKIRLYYFKNPMTEGNPESEIFQIYSAVSNDGINFDDPKLAFENPELITDPDVFQTDGNWRMFISEGQNLLLATSTDGGITFQKDKNFSWNQGGVCETVKMGDVWRTFYCGQGGISSATGAESGELQNEPGVRVEGAGKKIVCDPSVIQLPDGTYLMFYKEQEMKDNNQPQQEP